MFASDTQCDHVDNQDGNPRETFVPDGLSAILYMRLYRTAYQLSTLYPQKDICVSNFNQYKKNSEQTVIPEVK